MVPALFRSGGAPTVVVSVTGIVTMSVEVDTTVTTGGVNVCVMNFEQSDATGRVGNADAGCPVN